jgi:hypothetical protein
MKSGGGMSTLKRLISSFAVVLLGIALVVCANTASAQSDLEKSIEQYNSQQVVGYVQPVADLFGAAMHSGNYHTAQIDQWGFSLSVDIVAMASMVQDAQKVYTLSMPAGFNPATIQAPTIFGDKGTEVSNAGTLLSYRPSDGLINAKFMPLAAPQLTIGNIFGTQLTFRYFPVPKMGDQVPEVKLWGVGARHSISQYLPMIPVDLAGGFMYNSFTFGDLINFKGVNIHVEASKTFAILTVYGGLQWEKSTLDLAYTSTTNETVSLSLSGANNFRFTAGLSLGLGPLHIFGDANFGSVTVLSAGLGFGG